MASSSSTSGTQRLSTNPRSHRTQNALSVPRRTWPPSRYGEKRSDPPVTSTRSASSSWRSSRGTAPTQGRPQRLRWSASITRHQSPRVCPHAGVTYSCERTQSIRVADQARTRWPTTLLTSLESPTGPPPSFTNMPVMLCAGEPASRVAAGHGLFMSCAPVGIRTPNLLIRSQMLYPLSYRRPSITEVNDWTRIAERRTVAEIGTPLGSGRSRGEDGRIATRRPWPCRPTMPRGPRRSGSTPTREPRRDGPPTLREGSGAWC